MLNDGDDGVLLVRPDLRDVNVPYGQPGKEETKCQN